MMPLNFAPFMRAVLPAAVGLLTAGFVTSCGLNTNAAADPPTTTQQSSNGSEERLGCGTYCQSAGGIAGSMGPGNDPMKIVSYGTVMVDADGYAPVTLSCNLSVQCKGSLVLQFPFANPSTGNNQLARSDLLLNAGATATLGVQLPAIALRRLPQRPSCTTRTEICSNATVVLADVGPSFGCAGWSAKPTGLPNCGGVVNGFNVASEGFVELVAAG
jgi:hypothetical protein